MKMIHAVMLAAEAYFELPEKAATEFLNGIQPPELREGVRDLTTGNHAVMTKSILAELKHMMGCSLNDSLPQDPAKWQEWEDSVDIRAAMNRAEMKYRFEAATAKRHGSLGAGGRKRR